MLKPTYILQILSVLFFLLAHCSGESLDLHGKSCPCVTGYYCDINTNTCIKGTPDPNQDASVNTDASNDASTDSTPADSSTDVGIDSTTNLPCDEGFSFDSSPNTTETWQLNFAAGIGLTSFEMIVTENGSATTIQPINVVPGNNPDYVFRFDYEFAESAILEFTLIADPGKTSYGTCTVYVGP